MDPERFQRWRQQAFLALLFCLPLFYLEPSLFRIWLPDAFNFPKFYLAEIFAGALLLLYVFELVSCKTLRIRWGAASSALSLFIIWAGVSLLFLQTIHAGTTELIRLCSLGIVFFSAMNDCAGDRCARSSLCCAWAASLIVSLLALLQHFGADISSLRGGLHRVYATLGNPNFVASYLALVLPASYFAWLSPGRGRLTPRIGFTAALIGTAALFVTGARGGILAVCGGTVLAGAILRPPIDGRRLCILLLAIATLMVTLYLPSPLNKSSAGAIAKITEFTGGQAGGVAWRAMVWRVGWRMALDHPLRGSGIGSFPLLYLPRLADFLDEPGHQRYIALAEGGIDRAHQEYLQIWVELGLAGLFLFAWFVYAVLHASVNTAREAARWPVMLCAGCLAFLIEGLVSYPLHLPASAVTFFAFAGILGAGDGIEKTLRLKSLAMRASAAAVAIGIAAAALLSAFSTFVSEIHYARGFDAFNRDAIAPALSELTRAIHWQPHNGRARFFRGLCLSENGAYDAALQEMRAALATYSHQAIYLEMGKTYGKMGNRKEESRLVEMAHRMNPRDLVALLEEGNLLYTRGDIAGATACYLKVLSLKPDFLLAVRNLAIAYQALGQNNQALAMYERAADMNDRDADLFVNMGALHAGMGDAARARALWLKALSIDPQHRNATENLRRLDRRGNEPASGRAGD